MSKSLAHRRLSSGGRLATLLAVAGVLGLPCSVHAGGFELAYQSARDGGLAAAGSARRAAPSSAWSNPASLPGLQGLAISADLSLVLSSLQASSLEGLGSAESIQGPATPFALNLGYGQEDWALGFYVGSSHGSRVQWPEGWWGRFESTESALQLIRLNPSFAYRWGSLSVALGLHVDVASMELARDLNMVDYHGSSRISLSGLGLGGDLSLAFRPTEALSFAFTYRSRSDIGLEGQADFTVPPAFLSLLPDQPAASRLLVPDAFTLGAAWEEERFAIFLDAAYSLWSLRDEVTIELVDEASDSLELPQSWSDSWALRLGAEWRPCAWFQARLGGGYESAAAPGQTLAPSSPDMARAVFALGASLRVFEGIAVDLYYAHLELLARDSDGPDAPPTRYGGSLDLAGLGLRFHWDPSGGS